jgi:hypothetical protein
MGEPRRLTTIWAFTACYRDSFTFIARDKCIDSGEKGQFYMLNEVVHVNTIHRGLKGQKWPLNRTSLSSLETRFQAIYDFTEM